MNVVLRAVLLFLVLLVTVMLLGQSGGAPLPVALTVNTTVFTTTAPVAITIVLAVLLTAFYLGRLTGWLVRLPHKMLNRRKIAPADSLADAYTALAMNDVALATRHLTDLKPDHPALQDLTSLAQLQTHTLPPSQAQKNLTNPRLAAVTALSMARSAAASSDWPEVKRLTTVGRQHAPQHHELLTLQFKSLVNLNDPAATDLLPALKSHLGPDRHKLLAQILQTNPNPAILSDPWVKSFQQWLPTGSGTFPSAE